MRPPALLTSAVLVACAAALPLKARESANPHDAPGAGAMVTLVEVMARRAGIADTVAAAKWGTTQPIDNPAREKTVLDSEPGQDLWVTAQDGQEPPLRRRLIQQPRDSGVLPADLLRWPHLGGPARRDGSTHRPHSVRGRSSLTYTGLAAAPR